MLYNKVMTDYKTFLDNGINDFYTGNYTSALENINKINLNNQINVFKDDALEFDLEKLNYRR